MAKRSWFQTRLHFVTAIAVACAPACSGDSTVKYTPAGDAGRGADGGSLGDGFVIPEGGGAPGGGSGTTGAGGAGGSNATAGAYPCLQSADPACAGQLYMGQGIPTDILVMFDQSGSMACPMEGSCDPARVMQGGFVKRIDAVRDAVGQFLRAPESKDLGVGIGYFGTQPLSCACTSCNPMDYATPAVPLGILPQHAEAVIGSLAQIQPTGETPTGAAIRGACIHAKGRQQAEPTRSISILLVTDGEPQAPLTAQKGTCDPTLADAIAAAQECAAAGIKTYVLGIGPALENLNQIAAGGATGKAYLVASGGGPEILKALNTIRSDAMIPCAMQIPPPPAGSRIDPQKVNLVYASASCKAVTTFLNVKAPTGCNPQGGGWYYDDPANPKQIHLCPASCETVKAPGGQLVVSVGCMTRYIE